MENKWILHIIPNTHWDREWYMSFEKYRRRLIRLMDRLLNLLEESGDFKTFTLDGQFLVIKDYLEIRPEKEQQVKKLVREGRLLIGPWYTQPIESLASGEALIRNLILGIRESERFGGAMKVSYIIDEFGHISQLPMILNGFGIKDAVAWRGIPEGSKGVFKWVAGDGSHVFMFYSNGGYGEATALPLSMDDFTEYIDDTPFKCRGLKNMIEDLIKHRNGKATTHHLMLLNGIDHSFAQENLPEVISKINVSIPDVEVLHSSLYDYINAVKQVHEKEGIPYDEYSGEMMDSFESQVLPDTHSTRTCVKIWNSRIEGMFEKWMEPFCAIAWLMGWPYPHSEIWKAWEYVLQNHAHDSSACSSADEVYRQVISRFEQAYELGEDIAGESLQVLCNRIADAQDVRDGGKVLVVFNPLNWERDEVVTATIDIPEASGLKYPKISCNGEEIPVVVHDRRETVSLRFNPLRGHPSLIPVCRYEVSFRAADIPENGYRVYQVGSRDNPEWIRGSLVRSPDIMENEYLRVKFNPNGTFDILDKNTGRRYFNMHFFEDGGDAGNGYEFIPPIKNRIIFSIGVHADISIVEDSAMRATFKVNTSMDLPVCINHDRSGRAEEAVPCTITSFITLKAGTPRIDIKTVIDNRANDHRLRVVFPTGIKTDRSHAEQAFDVVERDIALPDLNKYMGEKPRSTHPQQSFVDVSDESVGLMIANEGLYEYEVMDNEDRSIVLTLLRCTGKIDGKGLCSVEGMDIPQAQCMGESTFNYSVIPHKGGWMNAYRNAYEFKYPMKAVMHKALEDEVLPWFNKPETEIKLPPAYSFLKVEPDGLLVSAVKKHETNESLVVRLFNIECEMTKGRIRVNIPGHRFAEAYQVNLNENREKELTVDENGWIGVEVRKKGLFTIELTY
ncbi:MAG: glycoside hydrolase family 38 C-terminal domain-containing protein [Clostridiales bacterium]|nr:glycoside hydrolase family 38 C-terminal domain-containing protein [Clostridiales bacterium]